MRPVVLPANELVLQNYSAEFPPIGPPYSSMRSGVMANQLTQLLQQSPDAPETFEMLVYMERPAEAAAALRRMIQRDPGRLAWAFDVLRIRNFARGPLANLADVPWPELFAEARRALGRMTTPDAARLELALINAVRATAVGLNPNQARITALRAFIDKYAGNDVALEAEVELIMSTTARSQWIPPLEEFARQHPGTTAAARALYEKAVQIRSNDRAGVRDLNRPNLDPTNAVLDALGIARDLRSGRYPDSEWVTRAPELAINLRSGNPQFAADSVERLLAGYLDFVRANFTLPEASPLADGINSVITNQIFELFVLTGEGIAGVERTLTDLERIDAPRARYARAAFYLNRMASDEAMRPIMRQRAVDTLSTLAGSGSGLYARRALAALASLLYLERDFMAARTAFARYLAAYPDTSWSWVAAIRIGQCHELLGNLVQAIDAYRSAAARFASIPVARHLGHAYAGRTSEAADRLEDAAAEYSLALEGWGDLRGTARMEGYRGSDVPAWTSVDVEGLALKNRLDQIRASLAVPEGRQLESGRRLLAANDRAAALVAFEAFIRANAASTLLPEARRLVRRIRLEQAIEQAGTITAPRDEAGAIAALAAIDSEPWDEFAGVAKIIAATLTLRQGSRVQADAMITAALQEWLEKQTTTPSTLPPAAAEDVAAIRRDIFEGDQAAPWRSSFGLNSRERPAFLVINPHITVQLNNAIATRETVYPASSRLPLFMTTEAMTLLVDSLNALAGEVRERRQFPNVPPEMRNFLGTHLPLEMGMLCCVVTSFNSVPNVQAVAFTNDERTRANVTIRMLWSGGSLVLEKTGGSWRVVGISDRYVN
jgi:tetratricopeptide (TPR) repeat protein